MAHFFFKKNNNYLVSGAGVKNYDLLITCLPARPVVPTSLYLKAVPTISLTSSLASINLFLDTKYLGDSFINLNINDVQY